MGQIASHSDTPPEVVSEIGGVLVSRLSIEEDDWVREEISLALSS